MKKWQKVVSYILIWVVTLVIAGFVANILGLGIIGYVGIIAGGVMVTRRVKKRWTK